MKKSIPVRILTALGGLLLLALAACVVAEGFFAVPVTQHLGALLASRHALAVLCKIVGALALLVLCGAAVVCALPGRKVQPSGYVMQKGETGSFGIAIKAIEKDVLACVAKHREIVAAEVSVREVRDGLVILLDVDQTPGVSIPLSVSRLQQQVRQYVQERTGKDVAEVRVMVDCRTDAQIESDYAVLDTVMGENPVRTEPVRQESQPVAETPVEQVRQLAEIAQQLPDEPAKEPEEPAQPIVVQEPDPSIDAALNALDEMNAQLKAAPEIGELFEDGEKSMHQRVFGAEEMPLVVPMPPEMEAEAQPEVEEEPAVADEAAPEADPEEVHVVPAEDEEMSWTEPSLQAAAETLLTADLEVPVEPETAAVEDAQEEETESLQ